MSSFGGWGVPGTGALVETTESEILWGGDRAKGFVLEQNGNYSGAIRDLGNTGQTHVIRPGLLVGKLTTGGELMEWDPTATDGSQDIYGVVPYEFRATDFDDNSVDRVLSVIVRAPLKASSLLCNVAGSSGALVGSADEFIAREALVGSGSILDDDPQGFLGGASWRRKIHTGDLTLTSADNYTSYRCHSADADFILPAVANGLKFRFFMGEDFELQVSSATSVFLTGNDAVGDGITYTTGGEQVGVHIEVEGVNMDIAGTNTPTWIMTHLVTPFSTDDFFDRTIDT